MTVANLTKLYGEQRSSVFERPAPRVIGEGVWLDRMQPGGRDGPNDEVRSLFPGGRVWTDMFHFGGTDDDFILTVPDIRLPANQYWPLHWHDCWIAVIILDGSCMIGDWWMEQGDVLISAAGIEYGPLLIGPDGCQLFEVFAQLHLSGGGYAPEYRDHPTLVGGQHVFIERSEINRRNEGRSCLPVDGVDGLYKARLGANRAWDLGEPDDPERGVMASTVLPASETFPSHSYRDWHGIFVMDGSLQVGRNSLSKGDVLVVQPGAQVDEIIVGEEGAELFEVARTAKGMERVT